MAVNRCGSSNSSTNSTTNSNVSSRRRLLTTAALMASGAALLVLSSSSVGEGGHSYGYGGFGGNLRLSRRLDADSDGEDDTNTAATASAALSGSISPSISQTVVELTEPLLADESNIFAFDASDPRPVVHTFFAIPEGLTIRKDDAQTLAVWKQAWSALGWNPVSGIYIHVALHVQVL